MISLTASGRRLAARRRPPQPNNIHVVCIEYHAYIGADNNGVESMRDKDDGNVDDDGGNRHFGRPNAVDLTHTQRMRDPITFGRLWPNGTLFRPRSTFVFRPNAGAHSSLRSSSMSSPTGTKSIYISLAVARIQRPDSRCGGGFAFVSHVLRQVCWAFFVRACGRRANRVKSLRR